MERCGGYKKIQRIEDTPSYQYFSPIPFDSLWIKDDDKISYCWRAVPHEEECQKQRAGHRRDRPHGNYLYALRAHMPLPKWEPSRTPLSHPSVDHWCHFIRSLLSSTPAQDHCKRKTVPAQSPFPQVRTTQPFPL